MMEQLEVQIVSRERIEVLGQDNAVISVMTLAPAEAIEIVERGPQGARGDTGPPGPPGSAVSHEHVQASPSATWTVNHGLGFRPSVTVYSAGGVEVEANVTHTSINQAIISFVVPVSGTARLI
jgi:hypothetical protein